MWTIDEIFNNRKDNPLYNTSYPLNPKDWKKYEVDGVLPIGSRPLSFYLHIPFCQQSCSFCEYTRMKCPSNELQHKYIDTLKKDISSFLDNHGAVMLQGCDIGGGTPTALSHSCFSRLMDIYSYIICRTLQSEDFEPSIEATFQTLDDSKIRMIANTGIKRVSIGIQSSDKRLLDTHLRSSETVKKMALTLDKLYAAGIEKVNLDLMYGLNAQTLQSIKNDIETICLLSPQQITLYELRTNSNGYTSMMTKEELFSMYCAYFDAFVNMGFHARFGQNTFSIDINDKGVSSYLRHRMTKGGDYRGFGISAQSMSQSGISYNICKGKELSGTELEATTYDNIRYYKLPPHELASKYIAISAYHGAFSLEHVTEILGENANTKYHDVIDYCTRNNFITINDDIVRITRDGYKYYGAIFSLFYLPSNTSSYCA